MGAALRKDDFAELDELRRLYALVPKHVDIKFKLVPGTEFLIALRRTAGKIPVAQVAAALSVTPTTIYSMRSIAIEKHPARWPTDREMAGVNRAWARIRGRRYPGYLSQEHLAMHRALKALIDEGFVVKVIARRMKVPVADLDKYVKEPAAPSVLSQRVQRAVSATKRLASDPTPTDGHA